MTFRNSLKYIALLALAILVAAIWYDHTLVSDLQRFRRSDDVLQKNIFPTHPSKEGLDTLHISGSARPTSEGMRRAFTSINMPLYVFDFFSNDHYYINGYSEGWFGYKRLSTPCVDRKKVSLRAFIHRLIYTGKLHHDINDVQSEKQMMAGLGFHYVLFDQVRKTIPTDEQVDMFIQTVNSLPDPVWVHFHCSAGRGRTTIGMVMYDIMKNGKKVPLEDIIQRHYLLGSENLFDTTVWPKGRYTKEMLEERKQFIISFYNYVNNPAGLGTKTWQEWVKFGGKNG